jgi:hypothetical protein
MAGLSGKSAWLAYAKQTGKGTIATAPTFKSAFAGGNVGPVLETDRLSETDSSRDQSSAYLTTSGVEGSPELYVRAKTIGFWLHAALGTTVTTGSGPNYTHTITPGNALPWLTLWKNIGGPTGLFEAYQDCQASSIAISAEAGSPLSATIGIQGLIPTRLVLEGSGTGVDPTISPALAIDADTVFNFNNAAVSLGGSSTRLIRSFELTVENNIERQQTDDIVPYDLAPGQREISLGFDMLFENITEYNKFYYGGASGAVASVPIAPNIFTTDVAFTFTLNANTEVSFTLPSIAYEEFPIEPQPGGDPIVSSVRAVAQKATGVPNLLTAVVKNATATY